jgi:tetratricopeptide (TPR) repeat protein
MKRNRRAPAAARRRPVWPFAACIVLAGAIAYSNSLDGPFVFDDSLSIVENAPLRQWWNLEPLLFPERESPTAGRPLVNLSLALNFALGGLEVRGYHVYNVACHLLCGLLLFGIVRRTMALPRMSERVRDAATPVAFAAALLWTVHPLNTEAVDYVTQRTELMMALFFLLTLYAGIRTLGSPHSRGWPAVAIASCAAGMACKESMVTAPVVVVLYDVVIGFGSVRRALAGRWRLYLGLCATWVLLIALVWSGPRVHSAGFTSGVSPWTYLLNQTVMITRYVGLAFWPQSLVAVYGWPQELSAGDVLPHASLVAILFGLTIAGLVRWPMIGFFGAWFFVTLAPTSSIVPIATEVGAERRMYLPLMAIVVLAVLLFWRVSRGPRSAGTALRRNLQAGALGAAAVLMLAGTLTRNRDYASAATLARTSVERYPTPVGHHFLANELLVAGERDAAMIELRRSLPGDPRAHHTLGVELMKDGKTAEAIAELEMFLRERPMLLEAVWARQLLGEALVRERRWAEAIEQGQMVLKMNPTPDQRLAAHALLADAYFGTDRYVEAVAACRDYLRLRPDYGPVLTRLGISLVATGALDDAVVAFRRAAELAPSSPDAQRNLANALLDRGDYTAALEPARRAVALRPDDADSRDLLRRLQALTAPE